MSIRNPFGFRQHIGDLTEEQLALQQGLARPLVPHRLEQITAELDQCWAEIERHARNAAAAAEPVDSGPQTATSAVDPYPNPWA